MVGHCERDTVLFKLTVTDISNSIPKIVCHVVVVKAPIDCHISEHLAPVISNLLTFTKMCRMACLNNSLNGFVDSFSEGRNPK